MKVFLGQLTLSRLPDLPEDMPALGLTPRAGPGRSGRKRKPDRETTHFFRFTSWKNQNTAYVVAVARTEGTPGAASRQGEGEGENSYLEIAVTH